MRARGRFYVRWKWKPLDSWWLVWTVVRSGGSGLWSGVSRSRTVAVLAVRRRSAQERFVGCLRGLPCPQTDIRCPCPGGEFAYSRDPNLRSPPERRRTKDGPRWRGGAAAAPRKVQVQERWIRDGEGADEKVRRATGHLEDEQLFDLLQVRDVVGRGWPELGRAAERHPPRDIFLSAAGKPSSSLPGKVHFRKLMAISFFSFLSLSLPLHLHIHLSFFLSFFLSLLVVTSHLTVVAFEFSNRAPIIGLESQGQTTD